MFDSKIRPCDLQVCEPASCESAICKPNNLRVLTCLLSKLVGCSVGIFICSLPYGSSFSPAWNFGLLLGLRLVPVFIQTCVLMVDHRWSHSLSTFSRIAPPNWYWFHTVTKLCLQSSWIRGTYHYTLLN